MYVSTGPYFTAVDLANFARELDEDEKATMAEGGFDSPQYLRFLKQPSANMDDSGYFSVQVCTCVCVCVCVCVRERERERERERGMQGGGRETRVLHV